MQLPFRALFAVLLWAAAATPPLLILLDLSSPVTAVKTAGVLQHGLEGAALWGGIGVAVLAFLYPPFLPAARLAMRSMRRRLGTDLGPLREAQGRLQHLETAADHLVAGRVLLHQGLVPQSLPHLVRAVELDGKHAASRYQLGLALVRAGQLAGAVEQFRAAVNLDESHAFGAAMLELGVVLERGSAEAPAIEVLTRYLDRFGPNRRAWLHRARARSRSGDREGALADLKQAAAPIEAERSLTLEDKLVRAQARVGLLRGGRL